MGKQGAFRIEPSSLHDHADAVNRQLLASPPLPRLNLPRQPHEMPVLTQLLFNFFAADVQHGGKGSGGIRRTIEGSWDAEDRGHFDIHRKYLPVTVGDGPRGASHRPPLLMLPIRSCAA